MLEYFSDFYHLPNLVGSPPPQVGPHQPGGIPSKRGNMEALGWSEVLLEFIIAVFG